MASDRPMMIIVMGVSGTGKSTFGAALSEVLHLAFIDGDDLHSATNVDKMSRSEPLTDADRLPWLERIRRTAVAVVNQVGRSGVNDSGSTEKPRGMGVIVACSALKKTYRTVLRIESMATYFVYLKGEKEVLMTRMLERKGHFMKASMLESQLDTLESPEDEPGVVTVSVEMSTEEQVRAVVGALGYHHLY